MKYKYYLILLFIWNTITCIYAESDNISNVWIADQGDNTYKNPILFADYSDPDVCRVGDDYYMTSSSFNCVPGLQILHSKDLVNWKIIGAALPYYIPPVTTVPIPEHGKRVYAPSIRYHKGIFYIFWGDPDQGIFMVKAENAQGPWTTPILVKEGKGMIDPCPLWDDDGKIYVVHAYAGSRAGIKSVIGIFELNKDLTQAITPTHIVFDGHLEHPTCEGTKFHKRNQYYYIFTPAGGVATGWQTVLRSKNVYGPYESKIVMRQGNTSINGPHQGAWIDTPTGEDWFIHFQDVGTYGRVVHLQPMKWNNDWPVIGIDEDKDGCGEPVLHYRKPNVGKNYPICTPQESDEFNTNILGLQWQWHANIDEKWYFCNEQEGVLRLYSYPIPEHYKNMWDIPNLLLQKIPAPNFNVITKVRFDPSHLYKGEKCGLIIMGKDYGGLFMEKTDTGISLSQTECYNAINGNNEIANQIINLSQKTVYLKIDVRAKWDISQKNLSKKDRISQSTFYYSLDGENYVEIGKVFTPKEGVWIGAKIGFFCVRPHINYGDGGWLDIDWFRIIQ